jgi:hypothetical protein
MAFSKIVSHRALEDLGTMVLAQQTILDKFCSWCQQVDVAYIFRITSLSEFHDHRAVASASTVDLLTHYKAIPLGAVLKYQAFVNEWQSDIDVESCDWALQVLELSTVPTLLVQIKQSFEILPKTQQGGLTLFKLLVDKLDAKTFENTKLLQDYITSFCLDRIPAVRMYLWDLLASRLLPRCFPDQICRRISSRTTSMACPPVGMKSFILSAPLS